MTRNERGRGATLLDGGAPLGAALGAILIAGLIAGLGSWRLSFVVAGVGTVLAGVCCLVLHPQPPARASRRQRRRGQYIEAGHARRTPQCAAGGRRQRLMDFFRYRSVWGMCFGWMCFNTVFYGLLTWMPNYLSKVHGFDIKQTGRRIVHHVLLGFVGEMVGGYLSDNWKAAGGSSNKVLSHAVRRRLGHRHDLDLHGLAGHGPDRSSSSCCPSRCSSCAGAACTGASRRSSRTRDAPGSSAA